MSQLMYTCIADYNSFFGFVVVFSFYFIPLVWLLMPFIPKLKFNLKNKNKNHFVAQKNILLTMHQQIRMLLFDFIA